MFSSYRKSVTQKESAERALGQYFQRLEAQERVSITDEKNLPLKQGCEAIVEALLQAIHIKDPRFDFVFHGTGSSYDGVKVGRPDEFDFVAEVTDLSRPDAVTIVKASDPGFVKIEVPSMEMKKKWRDCLVLPHRLQSTDSDIIYPVKIAHQLDRMELTETDISNSNCILAPFKIQKVFTTLVNECMTSLQLPEKWEHSGYKKPEYSGCRRHGPAAMLEFDYIRDTETVKVNIDITVGIAVSLPTSVDKLNLYVFQNVSGNKVIEEKLKHVFENGPQLHLIPLYSSALVKTRKFENKYAWRISCSVVETLILDSFPDTGPKLCLRMIKAIRDKFLSPSKKKLRQMSSRRVKSPKSSDSTEEHAETDTPKGGSLEKTVQETTKDESLVQEKANHDDYSSSSCSEADRDSPMPAYEYADKIRKIQEDWDEIRQTYGKLTMQNQATNPQDAVTPVKDEANTYMYIENSGYPGFAGTTDVMVMEEQMKESAFKELCKTRMPISREEISNMFAEPDSGEYFGPRTYMSSIEIKTYILHLIGKHEQSSFWSMDNIAKNVNDFLRSYHTILLEKRMMKNFFFDSMVCAPISEEQRLEALKKFSKLFQELNKVMVDMN